MTRSTLFAAAALLAFAAPAHAEWTAANAAVAQAAKNPRVAAALDAATRVDNSVVTGDKAAFLSIFTPETRVNNPGNIMSDRAMVERIFASGAISYEYLRRSIEYAAPRRDDEVVLMGQETLKPRAGAPNAGKIVRRRFTDLWRLDNGTWKLSLRQATIISVEAAEATPVVRRPQR